jgi:endoglucanase
MFMNARKLIVWLVLSEFAFVFSSLADIQFAGVNLSGADFGVVGGALPGTFGNQYTYPTAAEVAYYQGRGMNIIRLPFRWERLQHTNNAAFDSAELGRINTFVSYATSNGMYVILDPHNFQRYWPLIDNYNDMQSGSVGLVGNTVVPNSAFSNFWYQIANIYKTNDHVIFGLMNEPNAVQQSQLVPSLNAAIAAIRATGATNMIFVPGNRWTGAWTWTNSDISCGAANSVAMLGIVDSANNYVFEVHQYLDSDGSGTKTSIVSATVGMERLTNFTAWARANHVKGFLGEFAVPGLTVVGSGLGGPALTNMLNYIRTNSDAWLGWTYWGGGPWWGTNALFLIEPAKINSPTDWPTMTAIRSFFPFPVPALVLNTNQFVFQTQQGFVYQPQVSTNLASGPWSNFGSSITGTGTNGAAQTITMQTGTGPAGFYRIQINRTP